MVSKYNDSLTLGSHTMSLGGQYGLDILWILRPPDSGAQYYPAKCVTSIVD